MEIPGTVQEFIKVQEEKGTIDSALSSTKVSDVWDRLWKGDDNSEDESELGLFSDMTIWEVIRAVSGKTNWPDIITIEHSLTGEWRRTTWHELVQAAWELKT